MPTAVIHDRFTIQLPKSILNTLNIGIGDTIEVEPSPPKTIKLKRNTKDIFDLAGTINVKEQFDFHRLRDKTIKELSQKRIRELK